MTHVALPSTCNSVVVRKGDYRKTCKNPVSMPTGTDPYRNEIHHILCEHAITDINLHGDDDGSKFKLIVACLCVIDWDINAEANLVGLPLKQAYRDLYASDAAVESPKDTPCHNVDHNTSDGYTSECKQWLHDNVWETVVDKSKTHEFNQEAIKSGLESCTSKFKSLLVKRGKRNGAKGTKWSFAHRFDADQKDTWYHPFSMGKDPSPRSPGGTNPLPVLKLIR
jgi:hypothetical protein